MEGKTFTLDQQGVDETIDIFSLRGKTADKLRGLVGEEFRIPEGRNKVTETVVLASRPGVQGRSRKFPRPVVERLLGTTLTTSPTSAAPDGELDPFEVAPAASQDESEVEETSAARRRRLENEIRAQIDEEESDGDEPEAEVVATVEEDYNLDL